MNILAESLVNPPFKGVVLTRKLLLAGNRLCHVYSLHLRLLLAASYLDSLMQN
jgi:hypothetical protein